MKRKLNENTSGSVASVATGGSMISRNASIYRGGKSGNLLKGRKVKEQAVNEEEIAEDEVLIVPGRMRPRKTGLIPHGQDRTDHEVAMARSDLLAAFKNAKTVYELIKDRSEEQGIEGWVQEKLIKANDYLNAVREYYEEQSVQSELDGAYGMKSCGCDSECDCGPDFGSMFESVMKKGVAEGSHEETEEDAVINMFEKLVKQGRDPIDMIAHKFGWGSYELDQLAKNLGFKNSAVWANAVRQGKGVNEGVAEGKVDEKAKSKKQQKFFGMVHAMQKGEEVKGASSKLKKTAASMSKGDVSDFAKTRHSGLPTKVKKK